MATSLNRAVFGFVAAVISVLIFHQGMWELLHLIGLMPPWYPTRGVPPFGVPLIIDLCFWGGVWGAVFGLVLPRLPASYPMWVRGLAWHCRGIGWPVHRPADQGIAGGRGLGGHGVCAFISDQRVLGHWRRADIAAAEQERPIETGLSVFRDGRCCLFGIRERIVTLPQVRGAACLWIRRAWPRTVAGTLLCRAILAPDISHLLRHCSIFDACRVTQF